MYLYFQVTTHSTTPVLYFQDMLQMEKNELSLQKSNP